ncbi:class III poly(R)-hydroxyalkanoic acid synthase subunit PhaE [Luteimonas pelagia]
MGNEQGTPDFEALARQYWTAWGDLLREGGGRPGVAAGFGTGSPWDAGLRAWQEGLAEWSRLAHGARGGADAALGESFAHAHAWYARMQQVAAQMAGAPQADPAGIAEAWRQALGATGENPFPEMFRQLRGQGRDGASQWIEDATPWLEAVRREAASWMGMPPVGFAREHQGRWQALARAHVDYQQAQGAWNGLMARTGEDALEAFERALSDRAARGALPTTARGLFDAWIDAAEAAWAERALSPEFREVHGALVAAQMKLRAGVQREVEEMAAHWGMPTRTEVDATHRKVAQLEREVRRLKDALAGRGEPAAARPAARKAGATPAKPPGGKASAAPGKARPAAAKAKKASMPAGGTSGKTTMPAKPRKG